MPRGRPKHTFIQPYLTLRPGRKCWEIAYKQAGQTRYLSTRCKLRKDAEPELSRFISGLNAPPEPDRLSIQTVCDTYIKHKEAIYTEENRDAANIVNLKHSLKSIKAKLGFMLISDLKRTHIRRYTAERLAKGYNRWTVIRELTFLKAALNHARKEGWLTVAPHIDMPSAPQAKQRWLTADEAQRLLSAAETPHIRLFIILALSTTARSGAILKLRWEQVDRAARLIDFRQASEMVTNKRKSPTPISDSLYTALQLAYEGRQSDYVIEFRSKPVYSIKKAFRKLVTDLELDGVTPHTLRHTAATWMAQGGVHMWEIAGMLGDSIRTVEKHYAKHHPDYLKNASNTINDILKSTL